MVDIAPQLKESFNPNNGQGGRYIDYIITWGVTNQEAQDNAVPSAAEDEELSCISQITNSNGTPLKIATFEGDGYPLNGTAIVPPHTNELPDAEIGLIFDTLSDSEGNFSEPQTLTIDLPYYYDWIAFTINFGYISAVDFTVSYYADTTELNVTQVTQNSVSIYVDEWAAEGCNKVVLSITKIDRPYTRARIAAITFGTIRQYTKSNSESVEITEAIDPLNERVPANEMRISVENFATEYNIFDPAGIYAYLRTRQKLTPQIGAQQADNLIKYVNMGNYYLQSPELKNGFSRLDLKATDLLGILQDTMYTEGIYKTATIEEFLNDVASDAGVQVNYPDSFSAITVSAYIPSVSHAEAFRRIAQATNTLLFTNRNDVICFKEFDNTILQTFTIYDYKNDNGLEPSEDTIINTIEVEEVSFSISSTTEKLAEISGAGVHSVKYEPSVQQTVTVNGGSLISANYSTDNAVLEISGGTATISGKKLSQNVKTVSMTNAQANEPKLIYAVKNNLFIQAINASNVASHYLNLRATKRRSVKMQYRGYPYIEMGDCVNFIAGPYLTQAFAITKNNLRLSGGMTGIVEAREI